jgi:hypothetical protein
MRPEKNELKVQKKRVSNQAADKSFGTCFACRIENWEVFISIFLGSISDLIVESSCTLILYSALAHLSSFLEGPLSYIPERRDSHCQLDGSPPGRWPPCRTESPPIASPPRGDAHRKDDELRERGSGGEGQVQRRCTCKAWQGPLILAKKRENQVVHTNARR